MQLLFTKDYLDSDILESDMTFDELYVNENNLVTEEIFAGEEVEIVNPEGIFDGVSAAEQERWSAKLAHYHKAAGHPSNRNLAKIIKDAGQPQWKVQMALSHKCQACISLKPGSTSSGQIPPTSTHIFSKAWDVVVLTRVNGQCLARI